MEKNIGLRGNAWSHLINDRSKDKKAKDYKNCLEATQVKNKMNHPEKMKSTYKVLKKIIKNS